MEIIKSLLFRAKDWRQDLLGKKYSTIFNEYRKLNYISMLF